MTIELALIRNKPEAIVSVFFDTIGRIDLPGTNPISTVHAPQDGWNGQGFRIAKVVPAEIPAGKEMIGRTVHLLDGVPTEFVELADVPPPPPLEATRAQAESALYYFRLPDGSDPKYYDQYEAAIQNSDYPPLRMWAKGSMKWIETHDYVTAMAMTLVPPIDDATRHQLFLDAQQYG
jgi:hypothetical protein